MSDNKRSLSRREFTRLGATALAAASVGASTMATAQTAASALESEFLMELSLDVAAQLDAGHTSIAPVTGGTFGGPRLKGTVRDGGADWITQVSGHSSLDVRITLDTDDGAIIFMSYTGVVHPGENGRYWPVRRILPPSSLNNALC